MTRWKKDETEFTIRASYNKARDDWQAYLPRPIMEMLDRPEYVKFVIKGRKIEFRAARK